VEGETNWEMTSGVNPPSPRRKVKDEDHAAKKRKAKLYEGGFFSTKGGRYRTGLKRKSKEERLQKPLK